MVEDQFGPRKSMYALKKAGLPTNRTWPPVAGYFETKAGDRWVPIKISFEAACDPETGETLDRSPQWVATVDGVEQDVSSVWPECSGRVISRDQYLRMLP